MASIYEDFWMPANYAPAPPSGRVGPPLDAGAKTALVVVPAVYFTGYIAWSVGTAILGLRMLAPEVRGIAALGALATFISLAIIGVWLAGWRQRRLTLRQRRRFPLARGMLAMIIPALMSALTVAYSLTWTGLASIEEIAPGIALTFLMAPAALLWLANRLAGPGSAIMQPPVPRTMVPAIGISALLLGAFATGAFVAPATPTTFGGLAPQAAMLEISNATWATRGLGGYAVGDEVIVVAWVFAAEDGMYVVRDGCKDHGTRPTYSIPLESVISVRWLDPAALSWACGR